MRLLGRFDPFTGAPLRLSAVDPTGSTRAGYHWVNRPLKDGSAPGFWRRNPPKTATTEQKQKAEQSPAAKRIREKVAESKPSESAAPPAAEKKPESHWGSKDQPYWRPGPNPTVDNVITRDNPETGAREVLMIQRGPKGAEPNKWALPGGFHNPADETKGVPWTQGAESAREAALRELLEETGLDASDVADQLEEVGTFEGGKRDPRDNDEAWSRSTAFRVHLPPDVAARKVEGADDAQAAKWVPVEKLADMDLAFDHATILDRAGVKAAAPAAAPAKPKSAPRIFRSPRSAELFVRTIAPDLPDVAVKRLIQKVKSQPKPGKFEWDPAELRVAVENMRFDVAGGGAEVGTSGKGGKRRG